MTSDIDAASAAPLLPPGAPGYRRVALRLRQDIVDGVVAPGEWLRLQTVAEMCGVSVQPVREALQLLEGEGLVQIFPNRGAQVRGIDRRRLEHIYDIREVVEAMLVMRFCENASSADIEELAAIQLRHDEATLRMDPTTTSAVNFEFHHLVNSHAGNSEALALVERYTELGQSLHRRFQRGQARFERVRNEHNMMLEAFRARDVEAAGHVAKLHVRGTRRDLLNHIDELDPRLVPAGFRNSQGRRTGGSR